MYLPPGRLDDVSEKIFGSVVPDSSHIERKAGVRFDPTCCKYKFPIAVDVPLSVLSIRDQLTIFGY